jgi:hypothetical protein
MSIKSTTFKRQFIQAKAQTAQTNAATTQNTNNFQLAVFPASSQSLHNHSANTSTNNSKSRFAIVRKSNN